MTTTKNQIVAEATGLLKRKEFNELFKLFLKNQLSSQDLIIFYKRHERVFSEEKYWQSEMPLFKIDSILASDLRVSFLYDYFKNDQFCNQRLNNCLLNRYPDEFIRFIKFTRAFYKSNFWASLNALEADFPHLEKEIKQLSIIRHKTNELQKETDQANLELLQFPLEELLLGLCVAHVNFKKQVSIQGNKVWETKIEMALVDEISRIMHLFFSEKKQSMPFSFNSNSELQELFRNKLKNSKEDSVSMYLYENLQKMIDRKALKGRIDLFCCGYSDFTTWENPPYFIKTNDSYSGFVFNNKKSQAEEFYLSDLSFDLTPQVLKERRVAGYDEIKSYHYYGIPTEIEYQGKKIDFTKLFKLLKHISVYKGLPEPSNVVPDEFEEKFGNNEAISMFSYNEFIDNLSGFFNLERSECEDLVGFLSTKLDNTGEYHPWLYNPFIVLNGKILWMSSFMRDRRWDNIILNKIKHDKDFGNVINEISKNLELRTISLFKRAGYKAFGIPSFTTKNGRKGDIDVLAYKNGCLIVAEAKSGNRSDEFSHATYSEMIKLEGHAAEQLEKIEEYIKEAWEDIKKEHGIETPKPIGKIKLYPLIITDYFEGDLKLYKDKYHKTSLLELDVIISNSKEKLFKTYKQVQMISNSSNKDLKSYRPKVGYDLWNGRSQVSIPQLMEKIEKNSVWEELENIWSFPHFETEL